MKGEMDRNVAQIGQIRNFYNILVGKPQSKTGFTLNVN
jgi:hypothetical protein